MDVLAAALLAMAVGAIVGALWARKVTASEIWEEVNRRYILKSEVSEYCKWMGAEFPVFRDAYCWLFRFDEELEPLALRDLIGEHRSKMVKKYIGNNHD